MQVIHRAISPQNIVWRRDEDGIPVIKLISLGHAKLTTTMEDRESQFFEQAHHAQGKARISSAPAGGALRTYEPLEQRQRNLYLAPEYKDADECEQPHYAMDWNAGLKHAPVHASSKFLFYALRCAIFGHIA
jgi:hypothetical protein